MNFLLTWDCVECGKRNQKALKYQQTNSSNLWRILICSCGKEIFINTCYQDEIEEEL